MIISSVKLVIVDDNNGYTVMTKYRYIFAHTIQLLPKSFTLVNQQA